MPIYIRDRESFKKSGNAMDLFRNAFAEKDKDEVKDKDKDRTKTKNEKDPTCSIFLESRGCNDIKYDIFTKMTKIINLVQKSVSGSVVHNFRFLIASPVYLCI